MASFIFIDNGRIRPAPETRIIKAPDYVTIGQAQQVMDEARVKAAEILREAEAAYRSEKLKGYQEGLANARREMAEQITATALRTDQHHRQMKEQTIQLVLDVFRKVLQDIEPQDLVAAQVEKALNAFRGCRQVVLKAHPALAEKLNQKLSEITAASPGIGIIIVKAVPGLAADEVILESETGIVEASLEVQLNAIAQAFRKELKLA